MIYTYAHTYLHWWSAYNVELIFCQTITKLFERELALLVALQGESSWKGGWGDVHWKSLI